jgi:hypothetical protein
MMADTDLSHVMKRLDAIERALGRLVGVGDFVNPAADPPPDDLPRRGILNVRLIDLLRRLHWASDPPPSDLPRAGLLSARLGEIVARNPGWFTDPPPEDFLNVRVLDLIRRYRGGFTDPAPEDLAGVRLRDLIERIPGGGFTDPSPEDLGRLTRSELEGHLHKLNAEMVRLKSLERLINERLQASKSG